MHDSDPGRLTIITLTHYVGLYSKRANLVVNRKKKRVDNMRINLCISLIVCLRALGSIEKGCSETLLLLLLLLLLMSPIHQSGQNHLAGHSEKGKKTRQTEKEEGRQHQGMDRPGVRQVPEGSGEQGKMKKTSCKFICGAPTTLVVKGLMMMMMINAEHSTDQT